MNDLTSPFTTTLILHVLLSVFVSLA